MYRKKVSGMLIVHELGDVQFRFTSAKGEVRLVGETHLSNGMHLVAAHMIAREFDITVIWQDLTGIDHFVYPEMQLEENLPSLLNSLDPRDFVEGLIERYNN